MNSAPFVSIIIPTKNAEKHIQQCIDSILNQTFQNFEIIVVDASTDNTKNSIVAIGSDKISVHTSKTQGVYAAMNAGIDIAKGEWLLFLGADDKLYDNSVLSNIFENTSYPSDLILGKVENINATDKRIKRIYRNSFDCGLYWRNTMHHQGVFYRKRIFSKHRYSEDLKILADYALNLSLLNEKTRSVSVDRFIAKSNAGGISKQFTKALYQEELRMKKGRLPYWAYLLNCVWIPIKRLLKS
jgi:glycosyltransferase involved in cell wall biosynthesis